MSRYRPQSTVFAIAIFATSLAVAAGAAIGVAIQDGRDPGSVQAQGEPVFDAIWLPLALADAPIAAATPTMTATLLPPPLTLLPPTIAPTATPARSATPTVPSGSPTATLPPGLPTPDLGAGVPQCGQTSGDAGGLRLSIDGGRSLLPNATTLRPLAYTWAVDVDPRNRDVVLELHQGALYRSADAGCTLAKLPGVPDGGWDKLVRAPSRPELWVLVSVFEARLAWTQDDGASWTVEDLPDDVMHFAIDPGDDGVIGPGPGPLPLAAAEVDLHKRSARLARLTQDEPDPAFHWTFAGRRPFLYTRTEAGAKWETLPIPIPDGQGVISAAHAPKPLPSGGMRWLVGSNTKGMWRSDDNGASWREANGGLLDPIGQPPTDVTAVVPAWITFAPSDPNVAYAVLNQVSFANGQDYGGRGIWRTADGGATWERRVADDEPVPGSGPGTLPERVVLTGGTRVFVGPDDPDRVYFPHGSYINGYGTDLYRSTDGLQTLAAAHHDGLYEIMDIAFGPPGSEVLFVAASSDIPGR